MAGIRLPENCTSVPDGDPRVQRAMDYMANHLHEALTLSRLAREVGVGQDRLLQLFRASGQTPHQALKAMRMREAARLLLEAPDMTLKEVAWAAGFRSASYSHFSRDFRAIFGLAPGRYRSIAYGSKAR